MQSIDNAVDKFNREADRKFMDSADRAFEENVRHLYKEAKAKGDAEQMARLAKAMKKHKAQKLARNVQRHLKNQHRLA